MSVQFQKKSGTDPVVFWISDRDENGMNEIDNTVIRIYGMDWNDDLTPWPAPSPFAHQRSFAGQGEEFLQEVIREAEKEKRPRILGGYSLGGLFSLWAVTKTDAFDGCVCASGSLWYPGFMDYLRSHPVHCSYVYLSLGEKEKNSRNPVLKPIEEDMRKAEIILSEQAVTTFSLHEGGHFQDSVKRTAEGIVWISEKIRSCQLPDRGETTRSRHG